jgi:hypothetical protein
MNGFLGAGATPEADLKLTIQFLMGVALFGYDSCALEISPYSRCLPGERRYT